VSSRPRSALVVGGGVIGTTSAYRLARAGWRVTLFDPTPGHGASWAAAGMLAPTAEIAPGEKENFRLQRGALAAWRELADELAAVTGEVLALEETGTLLVGFDASDRRLVDQFEGVAASFGASPRRVVREDDGGAFAGVSTRVRHGLMLDGDGWLNPDQAMRVLEAANDALGVEVVTQQVLAAAVTPYGVEVRTAEATVGGDVGVVATGAAALPGGLRERVVNHVRPVRGMTVRLEGFDRSNEPTLRAFVRGRSLYLVSRPGGYCVLGASSDEQAELAVEVGELQRLLRDALDLVPALECATFLETRQGLRPASDDLAPFLEVIDERWIWASGHYRHGVTLAPVTASAACELAEKMP
jgi:glycine oxidase